VYLVQIFLPLRDSAGRRIAKTKFGETKDLLTRRFGGLTAFTRAPAEGLWKPAGKKLERDQIVIFEVMVKRLNKKWWQGYRRELEAGFGQKKILILCQKITTV